ncbi:MAG: DUF4296 domain-containing protein [Bacteroidia bacterium]|nr:DUF4296 domain-containing protein [Bacteroidia bacterium]
MSLSTLACNPENKSAEEKALPEELMRDILIDFHVAEAIAGRRGGLSVYREMFRKDLTKDILEKYDVSKETFFESYEYYMEHPSKMDSIYVQIIKILEEKGDSGEKDKAKEKKKPNPSSLKNPPAESSPESEE